MNCAVNLAIEEKRTSATEGNEVDDKGRELLISGLCVKEGQREICKTTTKKTMNKKKNREQYVP